MEKSQLLSRPDLLHCLSVDLMKRGAQDSADLQQYNWLSKPKWG